MQCKGLGAILGMAPLPYLRQEEIEMAEYICVPTTQVGVHRVLKVRIQHQVFNAHHKQIKIVLEREEGQEDMEMTCFGVGDEMPKLEVIETWEMNPPTVSGLEV